MLLIYLCWSLFWTAGPAYAPSALKELYPGGKYVDMHHGMVWGLRTHDNCMLVGKFFSAHNVKDSIEVQKKFAAAGLAPAVVSHLSRQSMLMHQAGQSLLSLFWTFHALPLRLQCMWGNHWGESLKFSSIVNLEHRCCSIVASLKKFCLYFQVDSKALSAYSLVVMPLLDSGDSWLPLDLYANWTIHSPAPSDTYQTLSPGKLSNHWTQVKC